MEVYDPYAEERQKLISEAMGYLQNPQAPTQFSPTVTRQQANSMANALRGRQGVGALLGAAGGEGVSQTGQRMMAGPSAEEFLRQYDRQEQVRQYQQWQANQAMDPRLRSNLEQQKALPRAIARASDTGGSDNYYDRPRIRGGDATALQDLEGIVSSVHKLATEYKDNYARPFGNVSDKLKQPLIQNWAAKAGNLGIDFGNEEFNKANQWWAGMKQFYEQPTRHALFGATLTGFELADWEAGKYLSPNMETSTIKMRVKKIQDFMEDRARKKVRGLSVMHNPYEVQEYAPYSYSIAWGEDAEEPTGVSASSTEPKVITPGKGSGKLRRLD